MSISPIVGLSLGKIWTAFVAFANVLLKSREQVTIDHRKISMKSRINFHWRRIAFLSFGMRIGKSSCCPSPLGFLSYLPIKLVSMKNKQGKREIKCEFTLFRLSTVSAAAASVLYLSGNSIAHADRAAPNVTILHSPALIDTVSGKLLGKSSVVIVGERAGLFSSSMKCEALA